MPEYRFRRKKLGWIPNGRTTITRLEYLPVYQKEGLRRYTLVGVIEFQIFDDSSRIFVLLSSEEYLRRAKYFLALNHIWFVHQNPLMMCEWLLA